MPVRLQRDTAVAWLLAAWPLFIGVTIAVFSGRFTSRAWRFAAGMPGGYSMWGGILIACSVLMLIARLGDGTRWRAMYFGGLILVGLWWFLLGALFFFTALVDPLANPLGAAWAGGIGVLYGIWAWYERRRI